MKINIIARSRTLANATLVVLLAVALADLLLRRDGAFGYWAWVIGAVAGLGIIAPGLLGLVFQDQVRAAWDEQAQEINRRSYVFGYWIVMVVFLVFLGLIQANMMDARHAFFLFGPALVSPMLYWVYAAFRGRTD